MIRATSDDPHSDAVLMVPACKRVHHVELFLRVEVVDGALAIREEALITQLDVHLAPPHFVGECPPPCRFVDDALVAWAATGLRPGRDGKCARVRDERSFLRAESLLVEPSGRRVMQ